MLAVWSTAIQEGDGPPRVLPRSSGNCIRVLESMCRYQGETSVPSPEASMCRAAVAQCCTILLLQFPRHCKFRQRAGVFVTKIL